MKRITAIEFVNFKAFFQNGGDNKLLIPDGKNVLLYGENGSGKSSIYEGLKQFFNSAGTMASAPARHIKVARTRIENEGTDQQTEVLNEVSVKVTFSDNIGNETKTFGIPLSDTQGTNYITQSNLLNTFFSYRELLRTYLMEDPKDREEFRLKFAQLVIEVILAKQKNTVTQQTFLQSWDSLFVPRVWYKEDSLDKFTQGLNYEVNRINLVLPFLLKYFEKDFTVELEVTRSEITKHHSTRMDRWGKYPICEINLKVLIFGEDTDNGEENHLTVLNEARLSALAISIYLASLINTPQDNFAYKILFLDDIFIGLDMSNRLPLLEIIKDFRKPIIEQFVEGDNPVRERIRQVDGIVQRESESFFDNYQIFITTYDKHWFEIAKSYLTEARWQSVEMYSHFNDELNFALPLIVSPSLGYYEKAKIYFKKNKEFKDYPAAANYLRKECEQQLKRILYGNYLLKNGDKGVTQLREELDDLRQSFERLLNDLGFNTSLFENFTNIIKSTLNPLSHDNLQKPIYKRELEHAFELVDRLKSISKTQIISAATRVTVTTNNGGTERITHLKIASDVYRYSMEGVSRFSPVLLKPVKFEEGGNTTNLKLPECTIEKAYDMIQHSVFNTQNASNGIDVYPFFILLDGSSLRDIIVL